MADEPLDRKQRAVVAVAAVVVGVALFYFGGMINDFTKFYEAADEWLGGQAQLYENYGFFYFPWAMILIAPLSLLGIRLGAAVFNTISAGCLLYSISESAVGEKRSLALKLAVLSPFSMLVIYMSQWDTLTMAAAFLGFWAASEKRPWLLGTALVIMASKPTHVWLPALLLLGMLARWSPREIAKTLVIPAVIGALSFVVAGLDWPLRYRVMLDQEPPRSVNVTLVDAELFGVSLWPVVALIGVAALVWVVRRVRRGPTRFDLVAALVVNLLVSIYVVPYHFVQTVPALAWLASRSGVAGALAFAISLGGFALFWVNAGSAANSIVPVAFVGLLILFRPTDEES